MAFVETRLELSQDYGTAYALVFASGYSPILGVYPDRDEQGRRRPIVRAEIGNKLIPQSLLTYLETFYNDRGIREGFRLRNWVDYTIVDSPIAILQGEPAQVQLSKTYSVGSSGYNRPIFKPESISLKLNGTNLTTGWTMDQTTGVITVTSSLTGTLTASGTFDIPVAFECTPFQYTYEYYDETLQEDIFFLDTLIVSELPYTPTAPVYSSLDYSTVSGSFTITPVENPNNDLNFSTLDNYYPYFCNLNYVGIAQIGSIIAKKKGLFFVSPETFYVGEVEAAATVAAVLLELRRMIPFGMKWFSLRVVDSIKSVLGSMLFSEANLYFSWALYMYTLQKEVSPLTAKFDSAQRWFELMFGRALIGSDGFLRQLMKTYIEFDYHNVSNYISFLKDFYGLDVETTPNQPPAYSLYDPSSNTYSDPDHTTELGEGAQFSEAEYYSILYKYKDKNWVEREVPGFPIPVSAAPLETPVLTAEQYLADPQMGVLVEDEEMLVYPLRDYLMRLDINLGQDLPYNLEEVTKKLMPAGLLISYKHTMLFAGKN